MTANEFYINEIQGKKTKGGKFRIGKNRRKKDPGSQYCTKREMWEMQSHNQDGRKRIEVLAKWGIAIGLLNMVVSTGIVLYIFLVY